MPLHKLEIGNQIFEVICQEGEEDFLNAAAKLLDDEAKAIIEAQGRIGESRMLLMSGLLLADKMAIIEKQLKDLEAETEQRELEIDGSREEELETQLKTVQERMAQRDSEIEGLKSSLSKIKEELAVAGAGQQKTSETGSSLDMEPKFLEELEHKTAQVKDLTSRLVQMQTEKGASAPATDPYLEATIEAERDEAQSEADAAKTELVQLKEEMESRSKAETNARDELEAEISNQKRRIAELEETSGGNEELQSRLEAAEKTIERMVATAEAAAADIAAD